MFVLLSDVSWPIVLDTSSADLIKDFFTPALGRSLRYDRGVGFFSSGWLRAAAAGMIPFAANSGRARWVTSPILDEADWQAMQDGNNARYDETLRRALSCNISDLAKALERDTLSALAWMVADEVITFKLALPHNKLERGDFHDKFGIFTDAEGNQISFNGSYNDSIQGLRNYESIKVFCSWHIAFAPLVRADAERFDRLWRKKDANVRVYDLPDAAREQILTLRTGARPYPEPVWLKSTLPVFSYRPPRPLCLKTSLCMTINWKRFKLGSIIIVAACLKWLPARARPSLRWRHRGDYLSVRSSLRSSSLRRINIWLTSGAQRQKGLAIVRCSLIRAGHNG